MMSTQNEFQITLQICSGLLAVCRLSPGTPMPDWVSIESNKFTSITKTKDELSIVCDQELVPSDVKSQKNWRMLKIKGQLDFALVGILKRVITPLSDKGISIYAISTYDTDYILVQEKEFDNAIKILSQNFNIE